MFFEFALIGSSGSGKSELAHRLARDFEAILLSLDSLLVYKQINIASAKPSQSELSEFAYFGVNLLNVDQSFNARLFFDEYQRAKNEALNLQKPLIIVGGTSFYLWALMQGLSDLSALKSDFVPSALSNDEIYTLVKEKDPKAKIEKNDSYRLQKWLFIYEQGFVPSEFLRANLVPPLIKKLEIFHLSWDRAILRERIANRTKKMLELGLIDEAKRLFSEFDASLKPLNSIGLKECKEFLEQKISLEKLEELITIHTAQLAKRQELFNKKFTSTKIDFDNAYKLIKEWILRNSKP